MKNINTNNIKKLLPVELHSIFIGIMLSDGALYRSSPTANTRFEIRIEGKYKEFALHIGEFFKDYIINPEKSLKIKGLSKVSFYFKFKTRSLNIFNSYYEMFYRLNPETKKYTKIVPINIIDLMDPIVLAYLIQGNGNFDKSRNRVKIYTNSYSKVEAEQLATSIKTKLNIFTAVLLDRKDQYILTIGTNNLELLRNIVTPHFHPSMLYKIGL